MAFFLHSSARNFPATSICIVYFLWTAASVIAAPPNRDQLEDIKCPEKTQVCKPYGSCCRKEDQVCSKRSRTCEDVFTDKNKLETCCQAFRDNDWSREGLQDACHFLYGTLNLEDECKELPTTTKTPTKIPCSDDKPHECLPAQTCFGIGEFCSLQNKSVQPCFPDEGSVHDWCVDSDYRQTTPMRQMSCIASCSLSMKHSADGYENPHWSVAFIITLTVFGAFIVALTIAVAFLGFIVYKLVKKTIRSDNSMVTDPERQKLLGNGDRSEACDDSDSSTFLTDLEEKSANGSNKPSMKIKPNSKVDDTTGKASNTNENTPMSSCVDLREKSKRKQDSMQEGDSGNRGKPNAKHSTARNNGQADKVDGSKTKYNEGLTFSAKGQMSGDGTKNQHNGARVSKSTDSVMNENVPDSASDATVVDTQQIEERVEDDESALESEDMHCIPRVSVPSEDKAMLGSKGNGEQAHIDTQGRKDRKDVNSDYQHCNTTQSIANSSGNTSTLEKQTGKTGDSRRAKTVIVPDEMDKGAEDIAGADHSEEGASVQQSEEPLHIGNVNLHQDRPSQNTESNLESISREHDNTHDETRVQSSSPEDSRHASSQPFDGSTDQGNENGEEDEKGIYCS